ncbi:MAG TPA: hypothetical protein PKC14_00505 [Candidatus Absconditabacterales bacterium]|nr:hypothetical protein [Candidatus Absconditabacterales bacterium]
MKFLKKSIAFIFSFLVIGGVFAADPSNFLIEVKPSSFATSEAVDMTIQAVGSDGKVVSSYEGDVFIEILELTDPDDYVLPNDGVYSFLPQDQGAKTFSKGLVIKKVGTYKIRIEDVINDKIVGEATVIVGGGTETIPQNVQITSPLGGGTEKNSSVNIIGSSPFPNSPLQIFVNGQKTKDAYTSVDGSFSIYVDGFASGVNNLQVKLADINGKIIGQSAQTQFSYQPLTDQFFKSVILDPAVVTGGQKTMITVNVDSSVSSAELFLSNGTTFPLDKIAEGQFGKNIEFSTPGVASLGVSLMSNGVKKNYDSVASIQVLQPLTIQTMIYEVKIVVDQMDKSKVSLSWTSSGNVSLSGYRFSYGTDKTNLDKNFIVTGNFALLTNIESDTAYYAQIQPLSMTGAVVGVPSDLIVIEPIKPSAPLCTIQGIQFWTEKIDDTYFLVWDEVENADKYIIYRSDSLTDGIDEMQKVGETSDLRFEYPFDPTTKNYEYAYYSVQAVCSDGNLLQIDTVKKVQVGPFLNIMYVLFISGILYYMYTLYKDSKTL